MSKALIDRTRLCPCSSRSQFTRSILFLALLCARSVPWSRLQPTNSSITSSLFPDSTHTTVAEERQQQQQPRPSQTPPPPNTTGSNTEPRPWPAAPHLALPLLLFPSSSSAACSFPKAAIVPSQFANYQVEEIKTRHAEVGKTMGRYDEDDTREAASKAEYSSLTDAINSNDDLYAHPDRASFFARRPLCGMWGGPRVWAIRRASDRCGIILVSIALVLGILTACGPVIVDKLVESGIDAQTVLKGPKGKAFSTFVESGDNIGVEIYYALRYLNLTNPTEVLAGTAKARLDEVGPFVYRQYRNKLNVTFAEDGETVSFILKKTYVFDEAANADTGLVDTQAMITTVHPVIQVLQGQLKNTLNVQLTELLQPSAEGWLAPFRRSVERQIDSSGLWKAVYKLVLCQGNPMGVSPFTTQTARDLYWGYHNDSVLLTMQTLVKALEGLAAKANKEIALPVVPEAFPGLQPNLTSEAETARRVGPNIVYTGQGATKARLQEYTMFQNMTSVRACPDPTTGAIPAEDEMPSCDVYQAEWGNRSAARHGYTPQWGSEAANEVRGTDGSLFAHPLTGKDTVVTFQEDYRRWVEMVYVGEVNDFHDLPLRRYIFSQEDFRNDSAMARDFYQENLPMGLCNLTLMGGFPLYLSKPHLLEAEPLVQEAVEGLHPDPERHLTYIDAEERSGVTFRTHKRVQLNAGLERLHFPSLSRWQAGGLATMLKRTLSEREGRCVREEVTWDFGLPEEGGRDGEAVEAEWMRMLFLPMVIYDESFQMSPSFTSDFKDQVLLSVSVAKTTQVAGPLFAVVLLLVGVLVMVRGRRKERELAERRTERYSTMQEGDILV